MTAIICGVDGCPRPAIQAVAGAAADVRCTRCPAHCDKEGCLWEMHVLVKELRLQRACTNDRSQVANDHDGKCPCGGSQNSHPRAAQGRRVEELATEPVAATSRGTAALMGITAAEFADHPQNFTGEKWSTLLSAIRGRSTADRRFDHFKASVKNAADKDKPKDADLQTRELAGKCNLPGGSVREFAGLLASMTAVAAVNLRSTTGEPVVAVPKASLTQGEVGVIPGEEALNDVAVQRLLREGRAWFVAEVAKIRDEHRADVIQYVKLDTKKETKKAVSWPDRYAKMLLLSYQQFLSSRPPTWVHLNLTAYLGAAWSWPCRDSPSPLDITGMWVQIGVLSLLHQCENWEVLGESLQSVRAHLVAAFTAFQTKYVLCAANLHEHKALKVSADGDRSNGRQSPRGGRPSGGSGGGALLPPISGTVMRADQVPAALAAGHAADTTVYTVCQQPGCGAVPTGGFSLTRLCTEHYRQYRAANNASPRGGGSGRGNRGGGRGDGGRGARRNF